MKTTGIKILCCGVVAVAGAFCAMDARELVVMSYNVKSGAGMDGRRDFVRTAEVIAGQNPEVVAVQELDSMTARSNHKYVLGELASRTGLKPYYAPAIDYDGGKYGIGILAKDEPLAVRRYALPGSEEARALIVAEFEDFAFACTHLSLTEADRVKSAEIIRTIAGSYDKPFFVAGDFNALPSSEVIGTMAKDFKILTDTTQLTFPADVPNRTLDYIMVDAPRVDKIEVLIDTVIDNPISSDHRPVLVKVRF